MRDYKPRCYSNMAHAGLSVFKGRLLTVALCVVMALLTGCGSTIKYAPQSPGGYNCVNSCTNAYDNCETRERLKDAEQHECEDPDRKPNGLDVAIAVFKLIGVFLPSGCNRPRNKCLTQCFAVHGGQLRKGKKTYDRSTAFTVVKVQGKAQRTQDARRVQQAPVTRRPPAEPIAHMGRAPSSNAASFSQTISSIQVRCGFLSKSEEGVCQGK